MKVKRLAFSSVYGWQLLYSIINYFEAQINTSPIAIT